VENRQYPCDLFMACGMLSTQGPQTHIRSCHLGLQRHTGDGMKRSR